MNKRRRRAARRKKRALRKIVTERTLLLIGPTVTPQPWKDIRFLEVDFTPDIDISRNGRPTFTYRGKPILIRPRDLPIPS